MTPSTASAPAAPVGSRQPSNAVVPAPTQSEARPANPIARDHGARGPAASAAPQSATSIATAVQAPADGGWHVVAIPASDPTATATDVTDAPAESASAPPASAASAPPAPPAAFAPSAPTSRPQGSPVSDLEPPDDFDAPPEDEPPFPDPQRDPGYSDPVAIGDVPAVMGKRDSRPASPQQAVRGRQTAHPAASTRYGESVVRELLGASFIEEQPHTPPTRFNRD